MFIHIFSILGEKKSPFSLREEETEALLIFSLWRKNGLLPSGWNWHLARMLPPVAVVSSGQSLHHSE
jgi:hypothetical protein